MPLSTKALVKSPVSEKKVKGSRKVDVKVKVAPLEEVKEDEQVLEEVKEYIKEEVKDDIKEILQTIQESEQCLEEVACPPVLEESTEPDILLIKCAKSKPLVNEAGDYLNPLTNRYIKFGSSNFKKLLNAGIIKPVELKEL